MVESIMLLGGNISAYIRRGGHIAFIAGFDT
jgi:hypothetical protein